MQILKILNQKKRKNLLVSVNGAVKRSKYFLKYDLDGGLYPDLQSCGRILANLIELKASDIWEGGRFVVEDLRRFLRVAPWLSRWPGMLGTWLWILEELWLEKRCVREDGCLEEVRGCKISGCLNGYGG